MALVRRHSVTLRALDRNVPLQVGNGEFAFGMDATGLQTFVPFNTMSHWGWHTFPLPPGQRREDFQGQFWDTHGQLIRYPMPDLRHPELSAWMAGNPHRINLGRIGFVLRKRDGSVARETDIERPVQTLDLWTGIVSSHFEIDGEPVTVETACHPSVDSIGVEVQSPLLRSGRLAIFINCPTDDGQQFANFVGEAGIPSTIEPVGPARRGRADFVRPLDRDSYRVSLTWRGDASLRPPGRGPAPWIEVIGARYGAPGHWADVTQIARRAVADGRLALRADNSLAGDPALGREKTLQVTYRSSAGQKSAEAHENEELIVDPAPDRRRIRLEPGPSDSFSFTCAFAAKPLPERLPDADETLAASRREWPAYWRSGGAIDLSGSADPRWMELERRIVLSQYLMKVNEAGSLPPQESGLVNNGWFGRWHMEMVWWHAAHWALWNRWPEFDRIMKIYNRLLPGARALAKREGYEGARWPKCIGPDLQEWPHIIHSLLIWQQPHPIFFAELDYRAHPNRATLEKWRPIVEATADFLGSYAFFDPLRRQYSLGPPLVIVSENTDPRTTQNPAFELGYWRFGLRTAQLWRERLGLPPRPDWERVLHGLSPLPEQDGLYVTHEGIQDMWSRWTFEHPGLTGVFGMLPGDGVDRETMRRTLDQVVRKWDFKRTWGWDFPMMAMCAARLGEPDRAIDLLLTDSPGFQFDAQGYASGGPFPYFPSNGGLLYAVALMAAGWDDAPSAEAPGFAASGRWRVRWENLSPAP